MKRLVITNPQAKTYQGPWLSETPLDGYVEESEAIRQGYRQAGDHQAPQQVEPWKLRVILDQRGLTPQIDAFIEAQPEPPRIMLRNAFEYYVEPVRMDSTFVHTIASGVGISDSELADIFAEAAALRVP